MIGYLGKARFLAALTSCLIVSSCTEPSPIDFGGEWSGLSEDSTKALNLTLAGRAAKLQGPAEMTWLVSPEGKPTIVRFPYSGRLDGDSVHLRMAWGESGTSVRFAGRIFGDSVIEAWVVMPGHVQPSPRHTFVLKKGRITRDQLDSLAARRLAASQTRTSAPVAAASNRQRDVSVNGYQRTAANIWPGKKLYLASDLTYIGDVVDVKNNHRFPDGSVRSAVLIRFSNGSADWIPRKVVTDLYD